MSYSNQGMYPDRVSVNRAWHGTTPTRGRLRYWPLLVGAAASAIAVSIVTLRTAGSLDAAPHEAREGPPQRVVSLSPSLTDLVVALDAAERLVGVTRFCNTPEVADVARVGGFVDPNLEAVLAERPDLVLVEPSPGNRETVLRLMDLGIDVLVVASGGIDESLNAVFKVSRRLNLDERGDRLLQEVERALAEAREEGSSQPPKRAAIIYGRDPLVLAGPGSFGDELLSLVGAENIAADSGTQYPTFPLELLIVREPAVVIEPLMSAGSTASHMPFLPNTRHVVVAGDALLRPTGSRLGEAAWTLLDALHPGATTRTDSARADPETMTGSPLGVTEEQAIFDRRRVGRRSE